MHVIRARGQSISIQRDSTRAKTFTCYFKMCANPVIISSQLDKYQEESLLVVFRGRKEAIGWNLSDLEGIDPTLCTHQIFLEEDSSPSGEVQRRLNPKKWDAVNDEILQWLHAGIIYPISDSPWVS